MLFLTLGFMSISSVTLVSAAKCGTQKLDSVDVVDQSHYSNLKDIICDPAASWCAGSPACSWPVIVDSSHQLTLSREGQATQDECLRGFDNIIKNCVEASGIIDGVYEDGKATYNFSMADIGLPQKGPRVKSFDPHHDGLGKKPLESHAGVGTLLKVEGGCADIELLIDKEDIAFEDLGSEVSIGPVCGETDLQRKTPSSMVIGSKLDGQDTHVRIWASLPRLKHLLRVPPGCVMEAKWPSHYKDVIFKPDGFLYDINGNKIGENMKCEPTKERSPAPGVPNPYVEEPEMKLDVKKIKGNYNGNNCKNTKQEHFLGALSRFKLPGIYTGTTKAVWPLKDGLDEVKKNGEVYFEPDSDATLDANLFRVKTNNWNDRWSAYVSLQCPEGTYIEGLKMTQTWLDHYGSSGKHGCGWVELDNGCQIEANTCDGCNDEGANWALYTPEEMALVDVVSNDKLSQIGLGKDEAAL